MNYDQIIEFSTKVFNYYNGYINPGALCILEFSPLEFNGFASYKLPNIVTIYPYEILKEFKKQDHIKTTLIFSVIHELYHVLQNIYFHTYFTNENYRNHIEDINNYKVINYILNNKDDIEAIFSVDLNIAYLNNILYGIGKIDNIDIQLESCKDKYSQLLLYFVSKATEDSEIIDLIKLLDKISSVYINIYSNTEYQYPIIIQDEYQLIDNLIPLSNRLIQLGLSDACSYNVYMYCEFLNNYTAYINIEILNLNRYAIYKEK